VGLFDFLRRGDKAPSDGPAVDRKLAGLAKTAADKRAQAYDREEAIRALWVVGTPQAVEALLKRFTFAIDPSITDQEEKALAFEGIVRVGKGLARVRADGTSRKSEKGEKGEPLPLEPDEVTELRDAVVQAVRKFCRSAESLNWPVRVLRELLDDVTYEVELLELLAAYDTEYQRNVEPKINLLNALEELISPHVRAAVETYLGDVNETVRFHAVETTFKQADPESIGPLIKMLEAEESVRVKNKVAEGLMRLGWVVPAALRSTLTDALKDGDGYAVGRDGKVAKG
jgi:HEAT repeat protein